MREHRHRILVVEDHPSTRALLQKILLLVLDDWEVVEVGTIREGLGQLDPPPDCIVLDLELPDGAGEAILQRVREGRLPTRIVVFTGVEDRSRLEAVGDLGPQAVIRKPLDSSALRQLYEVAIGEIGAAAAV